MFSKDSNNRNLSKEQIEFFKDTKVLDDKGNLLVCYHGTRAHFNSFKQTGIFNWFTSDEDYSNHFGDNHYEVYVNIKNPLYLGDIDDLVETEDAIDDESQIVKYDGDKYYLTTTILDIARNLDVSIEELLDIYFDNSNYNTNIYKITKTKEFFSLVEEKGYDGVFAYESGTPTFGTMSANQVKRVTNLNPTTDSKMNESVDDAVDLDRETFEEYFNKYFMELTDKEILEYAEVDTDTELISGQPHFVLKDGTIINVLDASGNDTHTSFFDQLIQNVLSSVLDKEVYYDYYSDILDNYMNYFTFFRGWMRCNSGTSSVDDRFYCVLPNEMTSAQYAVLEQFLDLGYQNHRHSVLVFCTDLEDSHTYSLDDNTTDEIIKKIKRYYASGIFYEDLEEDLSQEQQEYFKDSKVRDKEGNLLVCYHGTPTPGFKEFNPTNSDSQFGKYKFSNYNVNYFTTDKKSAASYTEFGYDDGSNVYACYVNIVNPYIVNNKTEAEMRNSFNIKDERLRKHQIDLFNKIFKKWNEKVTWEYGSEDDFGYYELEELNDDLRTLNLELRPDGDYYSLYTLGNNSFWGAEHSIEPQYTIMELFDDDMYEQLYEDIIGTEEDDYVFSTDDIVKYVLSLNKYEGTNYDGIIIPDIVDSKEMFSLAGTDVITLKNSNQIKKIDNLNPTSSNRIDEDVDNYNVKVYRVDSRKDEDNSKWTHSTRFFADSLEYYDYSQTGYNKNDAKEYLLNLNNAKVFDPMVEWKNDIYANSWWDIRCSEEFAKDKDLYICDYLDEVDYDDPNEYHEVIIDTDSLAGYGEENGYDVTILRDIPLEDKEFTEYAVHNSKFVKLASAKKFDINSDDINESQQVDEIKSYTCGYVLEDGSLMEMDEYHGEDASLRDEGYPEYSNTHPEEDTCIRIYKEPNKKQYETLEKIIDKYLDWESYCKLEIWTDKKHYTFYKSYSLYDGACEYDTDEVVGNWTGYDLVKVIKQYFINSKHNSDLTESKADLEKFRQWAGDELATKFFKLKDRLDGRQKDIYYWMSGGENSKQELSNVLNNLAMMPTKKEINQKGKEGAEKIYEDDEWLVYHITSYEGAVKYGKNTQWCISSSRTYSDSEVPGRHFWDSYSKSKIYFYINKKNNSKFALVVDDKSHWTLYDDTDWEQVGNWMRYGDADSWNPYESSKPHFPNIKGLPNINAEYDKAERDIKKHYEESYLEESREDFFKDSVVKDAQGNLIKVYHGSPFEFEEKKFDSYTNWFSESEKYSKLYGVTEEYYLNCKKCFDCGNTDKFAFNSLKVTKPYICNAEWRKIIADLNLSADEQIKLYKDVLQEKKDAGVIKDSDDANLYLYKIRLYSIVNTKAFAELVKSRGYDSVKTLEDGNICYGVFNANQVKSVDNENPTEKDEFDENLIDSEDENVAKLYDESITDLCAFYKLRDL